MMINAVTSAVVGSTVVVEEIRMTDVALKCVDGVTFDQLMWIKGDALFIILKIKNLSSTIVCTGVQ